MKVRRVGGIESTYWIYVCFLCRRRVFGERGSRRVFPPTRLHSSGAGFDGFVMATSHYSHCLTLLYKNDYDYYYYYQYNNYCYLLLVPPQTRRRQESTRCSSIPMTNHSRGCQSPMYLTVCWSSSLVRGPRYDDLLDHVHAFNRTRRPARKRQVVVVEQWTPPPRLAI